MLELGKESEKLKAMRVIVQEMAHGVDQSELFPSVVKCVVCKSLELKKLVYMYLVRYADELPDLALLSISTFQKGLKVRFGCCSLLPLLACSLADINRVICACGLAVEPCRRPA
jgi:hypothetical protein